MSGDPSEFERAVRAGPFDGAVLVAHGDSVLYAAGFGLADRERGTPNTPATRFRIASETKQFTAALVLQLVEEGLVRLDAPISTYLPDYPIGVADRITVHHLLTHTSGISEGRQLRGAPSLDGFLAELRTLPLEFAPGSEHSYSNPNYLVLGRIVEAVTGQPYQDALRDRLLAPLGLDDTGVASYGDEVVGLAQGYARTPAGYEREDPFEEDGRFPYAAGIMYSTVGDLHRWKRALHRGEPFRDPATLGLMLHPHADVGPHSSGGTLAYGYGLMVLTEADGSRTYLHGGRFGPFVADLRYLADGEHTVVALGNADGGETITAVEAVNRLADALPD